MQKRFITSMLIVAIIIISNFRAYGEGLNFINLEESVVENSIDYEEQDQEEIKMAYSKASRTLRTNIPGYEVINPDRNSFSTGTRVALINGKAPAGTPVTIRLYGTPSVKRGRYNLGKLPKNNEYIHIGSSTVRAGNLGFFQKQQSLVRGINKIQIDFNRKGVKPINIIVYVYDKTPSIKNIMSR